MTASIEATLERIRAYARAQNWTKTRFAREAGLDDTVLRNLFEFDWNPTADTVRRLEAVIPASFTGSADRPRKRKAA